MLYSLKILSVNYIVIKNRVIKKHVLCNIIINDEHICSLLFILINNKIDFKSWGEGFETY